MENLAELHVAVDDTRRVVKSLYRHTRTATQLLTDLEQRLDRFEAQLQREAKEAQRNGKHNPKVSTPV